MAHLHRLLPRPAFLLSEKTPNQHREKLFLYQAWPIFLGLILFVSCGGGGSSPVAQGVSISASASSVTVAAGKTQQLIATVSNTTNTGVTWTTTSGTVNSSGLFTAPMSASSIHINVTATSQADSTKRATIALTVNPVDAVTAPPVPPTVPAPIPPAPAQHSVSLAWHGALTANVVSFSLYRSTIAGGSYGLLASSLGVASYDDQTVQSGTSYYYVVTAVDNQGHESVFSNEIRAAIP